MSILKIVTSSLAYRLTPLYKFIVSSWPLRRTIKKQSEITLITMTGHSYLALLKVCLYSIVRNWEVIPKLIVCNDGTVKEVVLRNKLKFWPGDLTLVKWEDSIEFHKKNNRPELIEYASKDVFGKKLALIVHYAAITPTLWLDCDILFFNDFLKALPYTGGKKDFCGGSEDWTNAYDERLVETLTPDLAHFKCFNAGLLYVHGDNLYEKYCLKQLIDKVVEKPMFFSEQTIFAAIAQKTLGIVWNREKIINRMDDRQTLIPKGYNNALGRHYTTNVRHLFWRDSIWMFLNLRFID